MKHWVALIAVAACGGSTAGVEEWVPDDIDTQQTVDRLGAAGFAKVCGAFEDYVRDMYRSNRLIQAACTAEALQSSTDAVACGTAVDACLNDLPPVVETQLQMILDQAGCPALGIEQAGCTSSVSALTGCLDALGAKLDTVDLALTCAAFGSPVPDNWWVIETPEECYAIVRGC